MPSNGLEEDPKLIWGPRRHLAVRRSWDLWRISVDGHIARHEPLACGVGERLPDDAMNVTDRLGRKGTTARTAMVKQVCVEAVEPRGVEVLKIDASKGRKDVVLDTSSVVV